MIICVLWQINNK